MYFHYDKAALVRLKLPGAQNNISIGRIKLIRLSREYNIVTLSGAGIWSCEQQILLPPPIWREWHDIKTTKGLQLRSRLPQKVMQIRIERSEVSNQNQRICEFHLGSTHLPPQFPKSGQVSGKTGNAPRSIKSTVIVIVQLNDFHRIHPACNGKDRQRSGKFTMPTL